jgi:hypothetical protein
MGAGSSVRIEHHPPKVGVVGSNPTPPVGDTLRTVLEIKVDYLRFLKILKLLSSQTYSKPFPIIGWLIE